MSSNAVRYGSRLRAIASWVRVLAFGAVARRESYSIGSGELPTENGRSKQVNLLIVPVKDTPSKSKSSDIITCGSRQ